MDLNLYAWATILALEEPKTKLGMEAQHRIVRGLSQYHPRLTPINLVALTQLQKQSKLNIDSIEKALLTDTLITYGDQQLIRSGIDLLFRTPGGPIPTSSIMALVKFAKERHAVETCVHLWKYIRETYPLSLAEHTAVVVDLMEIFARSRTYGHLAEEVARQCLGNVSNPSIALSIAKVCYMLDDDKLLRDLRASPGFTMSRAIEGVLKQIKAKKGTRALSKMDLADMTSQEYSGAIKAVAKRNIDDAEKTVNDLVSLTGEEPDPRSGRSVRDKELLAQIALCYQYIQEGSLPKFNEAFWKIRRLGNPSGILLNLKVTWELHHGEFKHAKRHYQNIRGVPVKQRVIALNSLSIMADNASDREWVASERRRLEARQTAS